MKISKRGFTIVEVLVSITIIARDVEFVAKFALSVQ